MKVGDKLNKENLATELTQLFLDAPEETWRFWVLSSDSDMKVNSFVDFPTLELLFSAFSGELMTVPQVVVIKTKKIRRVMLKVEGLGVCYNFVDGKPVMKDYQTLTTVSNEVKRDKRKTLH